MSEKIAISRAVRLAKISRSEFQQLIKTGQLETFEGKVDIDDLKKLFPTIDLEFDTVFSDLDFIRKAAFSNRVQSRLLPTRGDIRSQLEKTRLSLLVEKQKATAYSGVMEQLLRHMIQLRARAQDDCEKKIIDELSQWLANKVKDIS